MPQRSPHSYPSGHRATIDARGSVPTDRTRLLSSVVFLAATLLGSGLVQAGIITDVQTIVVTGTVKQTTETKTATGQATITTPTGLTVTQNMPATGGPIKVTAPGFAFAAANVNLATQSKSHAWGFISDSGFTASSSADIHKTKIVTAVTTSSIVTKVTEKVDPNERVDAYIGPGVDGSITFVADVSDNNSGTTLFDSTTTLTNTSPDIVHDSTGLLTWERMPGLFGGFQGDTGGLPNQFSDNRWVLDPFSLTFDIPITLNPGDIYMQDIAAKISSSGVATSGSGVIGVSDEIPEPSALTAASLGYLVVMLRRARLRRRARRHDILQLAS